MPRIAQIIGDVLERLKSSDINNLQRLYGADVGYEDSDSVWRTATSGFTFIVAGARMTEKVAGKLGLSLEDVRTWPDGRKFLAVPLMINNDGQVQVPKALAKRKDWFLMVKVVTKTACDKKGNPFYVCGLSNNGRDLYQIDSENGDGTRSHSIAYYLTYGQMKQCRPGTEGKPVKIRPMNLIHLFRDRDEPGRIRANVQRLMVLRDLKGGLLRYKLEISHLERFDVYEKDPEDGHGLRILPDDIRYGLTGQFDWMVTAVRNTYKVLTGKVEIPLFADQHDPAVDALIAAIFED